MSFAGRQLRHQVAVASQGCRIEGGAGSSVGHNQKMAEQKKTSRQNPEANRANVSGRLKERGNRQEEEKRLIATPPWQG